MIKFWKTLLGSFLLGIMLAILLGFPWQFVVSLAVFVFILNTIVEEAKNLGGAAFDEAKKLFTIGLGVIAFVGVRAIAGYLLDMPASQSYNDAVVSGGGLVGVATQRLTANIFFELCFLLPGYAIAKTIVGGGGKFSRGVLAFVGLLLLAGAVWTMKQTPHAEATKKQVQAVISLDARSRLNDALTKTAAAVSSYGIAKEPVSVFYQVDATGNVTKNPAITNRVKIGEQVQRPAPDDPPLIYQGLTFVRVALKNPDGSFLGGTNVWVETRQFDWMHGGSTSDPGTAKGPKADFTLKPGDKFVYRLDKNQATPWIEVPEGVTFDIAKSHFRVYFSNGHPPIDVGEQDMILPNNISPTIIKIGSLIPGNEIVVTGM